MNSNQKVKADSIVESNTPPLKLSHKNDGFDLLVEEVLRKEE